MSFPFSSAANTAEKFPGSPQMTCNILWANPNVVDGTVGGLTFTLYSLILGFAVPLSLILVFYYLVIKKLQTVGPKHKSKDKKRSHRKVTRLVLTVITVYIFCWSPYWVSQLQYSHSRRCLKSLFLFYSHTG
jgi:allatostatin C receptor